MSPHDPYPPSPVFSLSSISISICLYHSRLHPPNMPRPSTSSNATSVQTFNPTFSPPTAGNPACNISLLPSSPGSKFAQNTALPSTFLLVSISFPQSMIPHHRASHFPRALALKKGNSVPQSLQLDFRIAKNVDTRFRGRVRGYQS